MVSSMPDHTPGPLMESLPVILSLPDWVPDGEFTCDIIFARLGPRLGVCL